MLATLYALPVHLLRQVPLGTFFRSKRPPRRLQDALTFASFFWSFFGSIFDRILVPTWPPKQRKIETKSVSRWDPFGTSISDRFLIDFWTQLPPPGSQKTLIFHWFYKVFWKIGPSKLGSIFDTFWVPTWLHFGPKIPPKWLQKGGLEASENTSETTSTPPHPGDASRARASTE